MTHRVSADFTGLCVFATREIPRKLNVLLANDKQGKMNHVPLLSFDMRSFQSFTGKRLQVIQLPDGSQIASWSLEKRIVTLGRPNGARPAQVSLVGRDHRPAGYCPENPADEMNLCWVPSIEKVSGIGTVDPAYLDDDPSAGRRAAVAARVEISAGNLFANAAVNRQGSSQYWVFDRADGSGPVRQYMADTVRLELETAPDASLVITASNFGGKGKVAETLTLVPSNGRIEIAISNLPEDPAHMAHGGGARKEMPHFGFYYHLLQPETPGPIPWTDASCTCGAAASGAAPHAAADHETAGGDAVPYGVVPVKCSPGMLP